MAETATTSIRWMLTKDLDAVTSIELISNEYYIGRDELVALLRKRSVVAMVAEENETVVGFMIYELLNRRIQLLDIAVQVASRKKGIGTMLIDKLKGKLLLKHRVKISAEIRETNLDCLNFLKKQEFKATKVLKDYFKDTNEDAFVMQFALKQEI
jgi:ribosomal-protein-alanine N-acetyltransferase